MGGRRPDQAGKLGGWFRTARILLVIGFVASLAAGPESPAQGQAGRPITKVALEGEVAPGTGGATFNEFDEPFINTAGDVTFNACYSGGSGPFGTGCGTFLSRGGLLSAIVVSGQSIAGIGVVTLTDVHDIDGPIFNNSSTVGLVIRQGNNGNTGAVLQKTLVGALTILAKNGDVAPGTSGVFDEFDDISQNNNDDLSFIATYTEDGGLTFKTGVFLKQSGGAMSAVVLNGDTLPGTGGGTACGTGTDDIDGPWMNDSRVVAFGVDAICGGSGGFDGSKFVKRPGNPIEAFVLNGDPGPASIGGTVTDAHIGRPGLNNSNTLGMTLAITGGSVESAVATKPLGGNFSVCVKQGDPAPDTSFNFDSFAAAAINQSGALYVEATMDDVGETQGIYVCQAGVLQTMELDGDPIPGTTSSTFLEAEEGSISDGGRVVFLSENTPLGVFIGGAGVQAVPTLSEWAMIAMAALLVVVGLSAMRRSRLA